jgi:hypothetical protein
MKKTKKSPAKAKLLPYSADRICEAKDQIIKELEKLDEQRISLLRQLLALQTFCKHERREWRVCKDCGYDLD